MDWCTVRTARVDGLVPLEKPDHAHLDSSLFKDNRLHVMSLERNEYYHG
jgi:hypothetical protein